MPLIAGAFSGIVLAALVCVAYNTSGSEPTSGATVLVVLGAGVFVGSLVGALWMAWRTDD